MGMKNVHFQIIPYWLIKYDHDIPWYLCAFSKPGNWSMWNQLKMNLPASSIASHSLCIDPITCGQITIFQGCITTMKQSIPQQNVSRFFTYFGCSTPDFDEVGLLATSNGYGKFFNITIWYLNRATKKITILTSCQREIYYMYNLGMFNSYVRLPNGIPRCQVHIDILIDSPPVTATLSTRRRLTIWAFLLGRHQGQNENCSTTGLGHLGTLWSTFT